ncbi:MAG: cysteine peptidase family C39 domain-containing protein [Thermosynechococcaceae cyanobacterium MS004]|nr:cysteine peptidase family C39 domain-containing protein [Thermosynechococcaceae cyanobacterium MS004]
MRHSLQQALGNELVENDLARCMTLMVQVVPTAGQLLWPDAQTPEGFYCLLSGRVRLVDRQGNLIVSLTDSTTVGEFSLFDDRLDVLQPYWIRASQGAVLGYFSLENAQRIIQTCPKVQEYLYEQALRRDLFLKFAHHERFIGLSRSHLLTLLGQAKCSSLKAGDLFPSAQSTAPPHSLWLIRQGVLTNRAGQSLTAGSLYRAEKSESRPDSWKVTQPTQVFVLDLAELDKAQAAYRPGGNGATPNEETPNGETSMGPNPNGSMALPDPSRLGGTALLPSAVPPASGRLLSAMSAVDQPSNRPKTYFPSPTLRLRHGWQQLTQRYPFAKQHSASDCGAACLLMVGQYWGKRFSLNQLRQLANVSRDGASLQGLVNAAESLGFAVRPIKGNLNGLSQKSLPAIAHWEGNHYIVVYAIHRSRVIVSDPALGRRVLSRAAFQAGWSGYTLLLTPTQTLKQAPEARPDLWRFVELIKPYWGVFLEVILASLLIQVFGLCTPILTQILLDQVIAQRSIPTFVAAGTGLLLFSLFGLFMESLRRYLLFHTANRIDLSLTVGFIAHAFRLPQRYFDTRYVGDVTSRVNENRTIRRFLSSEALLTLIDLLMVFVYFGLMFWYSWQLALVAAVLFPVLGIVTLISTPILKRISREVFNAKTKESSYLIESLTGITTIKALGIERLVRWHWEELFNQSIKTNFSGQLIRERLSLVSNVLDTTGTRIIFLFGVWQVINGQMSVGQLFAFNMLLDSVFDPFERLISLWNDFQEVLIAVERLNDVLNSPPEEDEQAQMRPALPPIRGHICFENVTFRYDIESDRNTLENISFEILPGQTIAIVGRSGSGKTTLGKLLLGLYPITQGRIVIDGYELTEIAKNSLRRQVGIVDQDTFLFGGTIRENIAIAHPGATFEEVREAARQAGADGFINEFPLKYETPIGEGGGMLSGGQRQRLAIARALLGNPRLLILDEATSSLDTESERMIQNSLNTILKNRTTLVIAHRLSTVRNADQILVLDRGVLIEHGTHDELMAARGQYFYLNQQQLTTVA